MSSEDLRIFLEDFVDCLNGLEASIVKMRKQIEKLVGAEAKATLPEDTFNVLKWVDEKGSRLGDYQVAYKSQNLPDNWNHAFNILKANDSLIANRFHGEGYVYAYWIYPDKYPDRIFRKKLSEAKP
ncbi:MAG: hypothetical protein ACPLYF_05350 [Fervidobacterium sp.]